MVKSKRYRLFLPVILASGFLLLLLAGCIGCALYLTDGHWAYPLDDSYIHLSIARHLGEFGNWGIQPAQFSFSSSAPLYTLLLSAGMWIGLPAVYLPVGLNILAIFAVILLTHQGLLKSQIPPPNGTIILIGLILLGPLHLIVLSGMEHAWQILFNMALIYEALQERPHPWRLLLLAGLSCGFRYEGLFIISSLIFHFLIHKNYRYPAVLLTGVTISVGGFGLYSVLQGGTFFPLSLLVKGNLPGLSIQNWIQWLGDAIQRLYENPFMWVLLIMCLVLLIYSYLRLNKMNAVMLILLLTGLQHLLFAEVGGYRYEAYWVYMCLLFLMTESGADFWGFLHGLTAKKKGLLSLLVLLWLFPLIIRSGFFTYYYPRSTQNIYEQPIQMAAFLQSIENIPPLAANDIGAISYFNEISLTDLGGISDRPIQQLIRSGNYSPQNIAPLLESRSVQWALVHDNWGGELIPENWICLQRWVLPNNFICAGPAVSFFARDSLMAAKLSPYLEAYQVQLPKNVMVEDCFEFKAR